ncbi:uncharacterized protein LOC143489530 [Brachyhypopomus gauderio]|uniref:uncharacterized protein LOC143489530 n=1 Tax=Brachyhypopomus gauderio TaxID=698409 RepID=UPI004041EEED
MAPKRPPVVHSTDQSDPRTEEDDMSSRQVEITPSDSGKDIEHVCSMLQSFITEQRAKDEHMRSETAKNEQRWRTMQHQFNLIQEEVQRRHTESGYEAGEGGELYEATQSQILRSSYTAGGRRKGVSESPHQHQPCTSAIWPTPRMPMLKDTDDIEHFMTTFERMAQVAKWPIGSWAIHLVPLLDGKARAAYVAMDADDTGDYSKIKQAILQKYEINKETYRQRFRDCTVQDDETPRELFTRLKSLYEKWMMPNEKTKGEIGETIILEQYLSMVSPELRRWIVERSPSSAEEAVEMAEAFAAARLADGEFKLGNPNKQRYRVEPGRPEGMARGGPNGQNSKAAAQRHRRDTNRKPERDRNAIVNRADRVFKCFNCNQLGHKINVCPLLQSSARLCYSPRREHSFKPVADTKESLVDVKINNKTVKALIDTGASQTLVSAKCVPNLHVKQELKLRVKCIHGEEQTYPTAAVDIEINGQMYRLNVGILDQIPYTVVLGRDLPILIDLLTSSQKTAEAFAVTRSQAKQNEADSIKLMQEMPFNIVPKIKKSRRERRYDKVKGTVVSEPLTVPETNAGELPGNIRELQMQDVSLKPLYLKCNQGNTLGKNELQFKLRDNILYRVKGEVEQLVVPTCMRQTVLKMAHSEPWAGHLGQAKTLSRIASRFFWPRVHLDVAEWCRTCPECQLSAPQQSADRVPMINMPIIEEPFARIAMDVVGPLPRSRGGNRYILVVCDYATRYPECFALRKVKTRQIVNALIQLISRVGIPREVLTDQGTNFTSKLLREVFTLLGIKGITTTPYHPQTDGLVERFNKTLKSMLKKFVSETGADWDQWLPYLLFAYREVPQASTGFSPFQLLYSREVRGPMDVLKEAWEGQDGERKINVLSHVLKMRDKMAQLTEMARDNMEGAQRHQKQWYDMVAKDRELQPGNKALVLLPTSDTGLLAKWQGPYEVLQKIGKTTYELLLPDRKKSRQTFHINMLRAWREGQLNPAEQLWVRAVGEEEEREEQYFPSIGETSTPLDLSHLNTQQQEELRSIIPPNLFKDEPGRTSIMQHNIRLLKPDPLRQTNCRVPARLIPDLMREVQSMLELGVIEPSKSEWCSPVVLVPKKDGGLRFCVDLSKLNAVSAFDPYPMPRADELVERLGRAKFLTTLDLCKGYWQVPLSDTARELTAFRVPSGLYHFVVMPFGLHGAGATFQRLMDEVLKGTEGFAAAYIDVVIYSTSWDEHVQHMQVVLQKIAEAGLTVNPSKCCLAKDSVSYLGYILGGGVIRPQVDKVEAVRRTPVPTTKRRVRSFLGLVGWYRRFIPDFSNRAAPLTNLTKKDKPQKVKWTEECDVAFNDLKQCLCAEPVLCSPDFEKQFVVQTDASGHGLGAVLLQGDADARRPILFISRKLFPREMNYSTVEKEALAVKWALDSLKYYLMGSDFILETDHRALQWMQRMKDTNARITRWYLSLQPFKFQVRYRKGTQNVPADFLSRPSTE